MPLNVDDLSVGQWVAVEKDLSSDEDSDASPFWFVPHRQESKVDGMPLRIVAISLPFLCVTNGQHRFVLDSREVRLCRLSPQFVRAMTSTQRAVGVDGSFVISERPTKAAKPDPPERACPVCGDRLIERYCEGVWNLACRQCGFMGGRGSKNES